MKKILILIIVAGLFQSCKKYLDIKPKGYVIPSTVQDYERLLNGDQMVRSLDALLDELSDDYYDYFLSKNNAQVNYSSQAYFWKAEIFSTPQELQYFSFYNSLYANIYQFNAVINGIDQASEGSPARKEIAKARAKMGRAMSYWYLVNLYAKPYQTNTASTDLGVSIIMGNDINVPVPKRSSVKEVYDFILKDLSEAIPGLPLSAPDKYQITKAAGHGILARTYLMMKDYAKAAEAAKDALMQNNSLLDYNDEYETYTNPALNLDFISEKDGSLITRAAQSPENIFLQYYSYSAGMAYKGVAMETEHLFDADDLRRIHFVPNSFFSINPSVWDGTTYIYNARNSYSYNIGIATPELYLIRAEANARLGKLSDAMNDVNTLRKNRIKAAAYADLSASNTIEAVRMVLLERRKELLFKGARWFDMRRFNSDPDFGFTAKHYFSDGTFVSLEPNSPRYVLRLPVTALTKDVVQNP